MKVKYVPDIRFSEFSTDWNHHTLGDLIEISSASRVHKNEWTTSGVRFFRSSDVVANFKGKKNIPAFISNELYKSLSERSGVLQPDDLLVTGGGSIGIPYLVTDKEPLYFKDADLLWLKSANKIDGHFLYYYFLTPQLRKYILSVTHIGTISHYTIEQSKATPIILPDVVEQTKIGKFFKQLDSTIARQEQELATLKQTKQGFLQKMFPKEGKSVPEVRFSGFTEDWEQRKLGDVTAEAYQGINTAADKVEYSGGGVEILQSKHITSGQISFDDIRYLDKERYSNYFPKYVPKIDDILFANIGTIGPSIVVNTTKEFLVAWNIMKITLNENGSPSFIQTSLQRLNNKRYFESVTTGNATKFVNKDEMLRTPISLPNVEEQKKIGFFFQQLDDTIGLHQQELEALQHTKKAFLQKMFL